VPQPERVLLEQVGIAGHHLTMGIVDDLLAHPGLYPGAGHVVNAGRVGAARIVITPSPGQAGVTLDYEIFNPSTPERLLGHVERTIIGRSHQGPSVMVISDMHAASLAILRETRKLSSGSSRTSTVGTDRSKTASSHRVRRPDTRSGYQHSQPLSADAYQCQPDSSGSG
jgi:hypothetical protein